MDFGMPALIEHKSLLETVVLCKKLGLKFVELNMNLPMYQIEQLEQLQRYENLSREYEIYFTIHLDENLNICDSNRLVTKAYLDTVKRTIAVAKQLHIPIVNMHMNKGIYFTLPNHKIYLFEKYNQNYMEDIKVFKELCEDAIGDSNIKIAIENTDGYLEFERTAIEYLLKSNVFALTWDIGHSHVVDNVDVPFILQHKEKLVHFHIHDATSKKNHLSLGSGDITLEERIGIAQACKGRCVVETKTIEALQSSVEWLKMNMSTAVE